MRKKTQQLTLLRKIWQTRLVSLHVQQPGHVETWEVSAIILAGDGSVEANLGRGPFKHCNEGAGKPCLNPRHAPTIGELILASSAHLHATSSRNPLTLLVFCIPRGYATAAAGFQTSRKTRCERRLFSHSPFSFPNGVSFATYPLGTAIDLRQVRNECWKKQMERKLAKIRNARKRAKNKKASKSVA